jgi:hypothetical protein
MWQLKAACRGPHCAVFFPPPHFERKADRLERERRAKRICAECDVRAECLEYSRSGSLTGSGAGSTRRSGGICSSGISNPSTSVHPEDR